MNHYYDLTDEQAKLAADGQLMEIRIPIEGLPQARRGEFKMIRMEWHVEWQLFAGTDFIQSVTCPYAIGDTLRWRESWINMWEDLGYEAGDKYEYYARVPVVGSHLDWQPASDMPDDAIRHEFTVTGVEVENLVTKCTEHTNFPFCVVNDHAEGELIKKWHWMITLETKP